MKFKNTEVQAFFDQLIKDGELSAEEIKSLESLFNGDKAERRENVFKSGVHARRLFDKDRDDLRKKEKELETSYNRKVGELDSLRQTLAATSSVEVKEVERLKSAIASRESQIKSIYDELLTYDNGGKEAIAAMGLDKIIPQLGSFSTPISSTSSTIPNQQSSQPQQLTKEDILALIQPNAVELARIPFKLSAYQSEYRSLTGKELDVDEFYNKVIADGTGDYNKVFLREYDIENLKTQKREQDIQARISKEVDERLEIELSKRLSTGSTRPADSAFFNSIASTIPETEKNSSLVGSDNHSSIVADAVADFKQSVASKAA